MTEESTDALVAPEKNGLDGIKMSTNCNGHSDSLNKGVKTHGDHRRSSISSLHIGDTSRNSPNEKSETAMNLQNIGSRYLRASTGSCHDLCKYGKKTESEEKPWKALRRRSVLALPNEPFVQIVVSGEQKQEKVAKQKSSMGTSNHSRTLKPSPDTKSNLPKSKTSLDAKTSTRKQNASCGNKTIPPKHNRLPVNRSPSPEPPEIIKREISLPSNEVEVPAKTCSLVDTKTSSTEMKTGDNSEKLCSPGQSKSIQIKSPSSFDRKPDRHSKLHLSPVNPKSITIQPSSSSDSSDALHGKGERMRASAKNGSSTDAQPMEPEKKADFHSGKSSSSVKPKPIKVKPSSSSDNSGGIHEKGEKSSIVKTNRKITVSKVAAKKALTPSAATLSPKVTRSKIASIEARKAGNVKLASYLKARSKMHRAETKTSENDVVVEKTLHVIKAETGNNVWESVSDDHPMSFSRPKLSSPSSHKEDERAIRSGKKADKSGSFNRKLMETGKLQPVKVNSPKKKVVSSEDKHRSPTKLQFRSGKIVDLLSDNNTPKRLRFRRARVVGTEDGKGDLRRRILKKAGDNSAAAAAAVESPSHKVILKHQDVQEKKDTRGLLNNVIEEAASKLAQSKKSKVKALVGAFETVISLHEIKPSLRAAN